MSKKVLWLVAAIGLLSIIPLVGLSDIGGSSEARESHIVNIIWQGGNWILPLRDGLVPSKPPLHHWIGAFVSSIFGKADEFSSRFPSTLFGIGIVLITMFHVVSFLRIKGRRDCEEYYLVAIGAALILFTTYGYTPMLFDSRVDVTCSFFMVSAVFWMFQRVTLYLMGGLSLRETIRPVDYLVFFTACGLAVLAKGPLGLALPIVILGCVLWALVGVKNAVLELVKPRLAWLVFLTIVLPWYIAAASQGGGGFVGRQIVFENIRRVFGGENVNSEAWWYYFPAFLRTAFPWSVFLVVFFFSDLKKWYLKVRAGLGEATGSVIISDAKSLYMIAFLAGFALFTVASGKRQSYLLPLYPLMSMYLSLSFYDWIKQGNDQLQARLQRLLKIGQMFFCCIAVVLLGVLVTVFGMNFFTEASIVSPVARGVFSWLSSKWSLVGLALVISCLGAWWLWIQSKSRLCVLSAVVFALMAVFCTFGLGVKAYFKGFNLMAARILQETGDRPLYVVRNRQDEYYDPVLYYIHREAKLMSPVVEEFKCPEDKPSAYILAKGEYFDKLMEKGSPLGSELKKVASMHERLDDLMGRNNRESVLFQCE